MSFIPSELTSQKVSTLNSTTTPLAGGATYTGTSEDVSAYSQITVFYDSDVSGSTKGLRMEFSTDGTNWDRAKTITPQPEAAQTAFGGVHTLAVISQYFRLLYTNGDTAQSHLRIQTIYHPTKNKELTSTMDQTLNSQIDVQNVRSVLVGQDTAGNFKNSPIDHEGHLIVNIHDPSSSFGEVSMAESTPEVQISFPYNINLATVTTGGTISAGTVSQDSSMAVLSTGSASASTAQIKSKKILKYSPGQGGQVRFTTIFGSGTTGNIQIAGIGDEDDGFFYGYSGQTFGIFKRRNQVDEFIAQTDWNVDKMDGQGGLTNPSNMLLNQQAGNVYQISYQWLGFGSITYYIENDSTGSFVPVHQIKYANNNTQPSIFNPALPIIFETKNIDTINEVIMKTSSAAGFVQGKRVLTGPVFAQSNNAASSTNSNILTIKNRDTFAGKTNKVIVYGRDISIAADGTASVVIDVYRNATLTTPSYTDIETNQSVVEYDTSGTYSAGTGTKIVSFGLAKTDSSYIPFEDFKFELIPGDTVSFISNGSNTSVTCGISWTEDF